MILFENETVGRNNKDLVQIILYASRNRYQELRHTVGKKRLGQVRGRDGHLLDQGEIGVGWGIMLN